MKGIYRAAKSKDQIVDYKTFPEPHRFPSCSRAAIVTGSSGYAALTMIPSNGETVDVYRSDKLGGKTEERGKDKWTNGEGRIYGTKGKDLNGLSQKAFSYSPWQTTMAKWREREHILNRFPSSVHDIFMCRATGNQEPVYIRADLGVCCRRCSMLFEDSPLFFGGFEFKRFKAISQGVAPPDSRYSNVDRPTTASSFLLPRNSFRRLALSL